MKTRTVLAALALAAAPLLLATPTQANAKTGYIKQGPLVPEWDFLANFLRLDGTRQDATVFTYDPATHHQG